MTAQRLITANIPAETAKAWNITVLVYARKIKDRSKPLSTAYRAKLPIAAVTLMVIIFRESTITRTRVPMARTKKGKLPLPNITFITAGELEAHHDTTAVRESPRVIHIYTFLRIVRYRVCAPAAKNPVLSIVLKLL